MSEKRNDEVKEEQVQDVGVQEGDEDYVPAPAFQANRFKGVAFYAYMNQGMAEEVLGCLEGTKELSAPVRALEADLDEALRPKGEGKKYRRYEGVMVRRTNGVIHIELGQVAADELLKVMDEYEDLSPPSFTFRRQLYSAVQGYFQAPRKVA